MPLRPLEAYYNLASFWKTNPNLVNGLIAAYNFSEATGTTTADISGNGNTLTLTSTTWSGSGHSGEGLSFNGSTSAATSGTNAALTFTSSYTAMAWVYPTSDPGSGEHIVVDVEYAGGNYPMTIESFDYTNGTATGKADCQFQHLGSWPIVESTAKLTLNTWTHIACVYDGTTQKIYINGVLNNSATASGTIDVGANYVNVGTGAGPSPFAGTLDDVRIYNRALSSGEVAMAMNTPVGPTYDLLAQANAVDNAGSSTPVTFLGPQTAGNTNIVAIRWAGSTGTVTSVTDTKGNSYVKAQGPTRSVGGTAYLYYAANIASAAAGANTVTVNTSGPAPYVLINEFNGLATSPLEASVGVAGTSTTINSGNLLLNNASDLLFANLYCGGNITATGSGFQLVPNSVEGSGGSVTGDAAEISYTSSPGVYNAQATQSPASDYVVQLAGFKLASSTAPCKICNVQANEVVVSSNVTSYAMPYYSAQKAGDTNVVMVVYSSTTVTVSNVTDTKGNAYSVAVGPITSAAQRMYIYYAKNIAAAAAGSNTVTVTLSANVSNGGFAKAYEYSGLSTTSPLDTTGPATGNSGTASASVTTNFANELIVGTASGNGMDDLSVSSGWRAVEATWGDAGIDRVTSSTGTYTATIGLSGSGDWVMGLAAFH